MDERRLLALRRGQSVEDVVELVAAARPEAVAIDSPRSCAPDGERSRPDERALRAGVGANIRWTPPRAELDGNPYYEWIVEGLRLYEALAGRVELVECFPTASWTRWAGPRAGRRRSEWTCAALAELGVEDVPARTSQDSRDAIAAAVTAREWSLGRCEAFGEIVVPVASSA